MNGVENKRNHFRLEHPAADRLQLVIGRVAHEIVDLSANGVKFAMSKGFKPQLHERIKAQIALHDGNTYEVMGKVTRLDEDNNQCVLVLSRGVPLAKMLEEQRYLLQKYLKSS